MKDEVKKEFTARIVHANRTELVVIKYDMIFAYMEDATSHFQQGLWNQVKLDLTNIERIVDRLMKDLDFTYDISGELYRLYRFCMERLAFCRIKKDLTGMEESRKVLENLYKAFTQLAKTDTSQPLMINSQQIVEGMTYGKNRLNVAYSNNDSDRGYFV